MILRNGIEKCISTQIGMHLSFWNRATDSHPPTCQNSHLLQSLGIIWRCRVSKLIFNNCELKFIFLAALNYIHTFFLYLAYSSRSVCHPTELRPSLHTCTFSGSHSSWGQLQPDAPWLLHIRSVLLIHHPLKDPKTKILL